MNSSNPSVSPFEDSSQSRNHLSVPPQPETLVQEGFNLRSQLFRKKPRTFLPFKQRKMPPRATEWIEHLGDAPIPPRSDDVESIGMLELDWVIKANHRGSCPLLHTLFVNGKAQSAWDPMPQEALVEYLETISQIPYSFPAIVEEYLPGIFDPIRADPTGPPRWYPKPILVAACLFAERRILNDPRTTDEDSDDDDDEVYRTTVGANLYNRFSRWDQSDTESVSSCARSIPDSPSDDESDRASTSSSCSFYSSCSSCSSCSSSDFDLPDLKPTFSDDDPADPAAGPERDSDEWDVKSINLEFVQAMDELERRGLELHSEI